MAKKESLLFKVAWIILAIIGVAILIFGFINAIWPGSDDPSSSRAIGVALIGMGLFGFMITIIAFRHRELWAWLVLWYYPIFWMAHFWGRLPPSQDQVHQIVFIVFSLLALLISAGDFFPRVAGRQNEANANTSKVIPNPCKAAGI